MFGVIRNLSDSIPAPMTDIKAIKTHQEIFLRQLKERTEPVNYLIEGIEIKVNPGVFPPATDTKLLAAHINIRHRERTLDLTTGSGVISVIAGLKGATGIAVDINPAAIENAKENFKKYRVQMKAIQSDLFKNVPDEQFDQIFTNGPFFEGEIIEPLDRACYGAKAFIEALFSGLRAKLKQNSKLLIVMPEWTDLDHFVKTARQNSFKSTILDTKTSDDGERKYRLYEVSMLV